MTMLSCVEGGMKYIPQIVNFKAWLVVVLNCFNCQEFLLVDLVY